MDKFPLILSDNNPVPCAVLGTKEQYQAAIDAFLTCDPGIEQGKLHLSDQIAVQKLKFPAVGICKEWRTPGWKEAKLIHFSHAHCGSQRSKAMEGWMSNPVLTSEVLDHEKDKIVAADLSGNPRPVMEEIRERLLWIKENSPGITRHHVHLELKKLGLLPKKK